MRIDPFGSLSSELDTDERSSSSLSAAPSSSSLPQDTTSLSEDSVSLASLSSQALAIAAQMEARVSALRQAVNSGEYSLEPAQIADAMLSEGM